VSGPWALPGSVFLDKQGQGALAGVREGDHVALCTSSPPVRRWLSDALAHVFSQVPHLGGVFTITASENLTNCHSHFSPAACARCRARGPADVIAEVNAAVEAGVHRGNPDAHVIVWDWGWHDDWAPAVINQLPKSS